MTDSPYTRKMVMILVLVTTLAGIFFTQAKLDTIKKDKELINTQIHEGMSPRMAITVGALGAFRGLLADLLFLRMISEQDKGNYFEQMQLGELIVQLQPDMPGAISYIAWNMAYNISVSFKRPDDRWRWVQRGIEIIRDEALRYNPDDPDIYHQLAWTYQHKIGQFLDDANRYYKGQLALQIIHVLGNHKEYDWEGLAAAPQNEDELRVMLGRRLLARLILQKQDVSLEELDRSLLAIAGQMQDTGILPESWQQIFVAAEIQMQMQSLLRNHVARDDKNLDREARRAETNRRQERLRQQLMQIGLKSDFYKMLERRNTTYPRLEADFRKLSSFPPGLLEELQAIDLAEDMDFYLRSRWLRDEYKLDAEVIAQLNREFGYLDFRLPEAHAIYWARQGLRHSPKHTNLNRIIGHSSASSVKWGRLRYVTQDGYAVVVPNLQNVDVVKRIYIENIPKFDSPSGYLNGFENWVKDTIVLLWSWGNDEKAGEFLKFLRDYEYFKDDPAYRLSLEEFALKYAAEDIADQSDKQTAGIMFGLAVQHIQALAFDELDLAATALTKLTRVRQRYYETLTDQRTTQRKALPSVLETIHAAKGYLLDTEPHPELQQRIFRVGPELRIPGASVQEGSPEIQRR